MGSPSVLPQSDTEAFLWAKKAAEAGLVKAMYAVGYFLEVGIGTEPNLAEYVAYHSFLSAFPAQWHRFLCNHRARADDPGLSLPSQSDDLVQERRGPRRQACSTTPQRPWAPGRPRWARLGPPPQRQRRDVDVRLRKEREGQGLHYHVSGVQRSLEQKAAVGHLHYGLAWTDGPILYAYLLPHDLLDARYCVLIYTNTRMGYARFRIRRL